MTIEPDNIFKSERQIENTFPDIITAINMKQAAFSKSQQRIADYILNHQREVMYFSITELAEKIGVGEATISRFCWKLGLHGFQELKLSLAQVNSVFDNPQKDLHKDTKVSDLTAIISQKINHVIESTIQSINEESMDKACGFLANARKIDFYGVGTSGVMAIDASQMFLGIGKNTTAYTDPHIQVMSAALLSEEDVAVAFSHSGSTKDTVTALRRAKQSGAHTICITSYARSPIALVSDIVLLASTGEKVIVTSVYAKIGEMVVLERLYAGCVLQMKDHAQVALQKITSAILDKMY
ncbi:MAG: MurR/RpiR family transcriptional regulator [Bacillota bacterium]|jgi:DNA-binding MurR/RpiR family transcriptional regulator